MTSLKLETCGEQFKNICLITFDTSSVGWAVEYNDCISPEE